MQILLQQLINGTEIRSGLSELRKSLKTKDGFDTEKIQQVHQFVAKEEELVLGFLKNDDAKTRKNCALLLGDIAYGRAAEPLYEAYTEETTLFVRSSYLEALEALCHEIDPQMLKELKKRLALLLEEEVSAENKKHIEEEIRSLRKIVIAIEGIGHHTADYEDKEVTVLLLTNRTQRETIRRTIDCGEAKVHPLGVWVKTRQLSKLMELRTYREMVFPLATKNDFLSSNPVTGAKELMESNLLELLAGLHKEKGSFYFRLEVKSAMTLEERSIFTKKFAGELESLSKGELINSTSDYEVEIRLIANKDGEYFPCLRLLTIKNHRFDYRKNAIAASIHPSTAALIMELSSPYLKENAQIMDPFCGVGTMLIERDKRVAAREMYGTDIFGDAIAFARENTELAKKTIHYIHRDFMDFKHDYLFDEIITNMPLRGKKTKQEMDEFYGAFFEKAKELLNREAVVVLYTNEVGFVKKQLRLQKEYRLLQETLLQPKNDFYLLILSYKG